VSYLPRRDADLLAWATNASTKITATPAAFGLTSGFATSFADRSQRITVEVVAPKLLAA
jgi:hypothetical protein